MSVSIFDRSTETICELPGFVDSAYLEEIGKEIEKLPTKEANSASANWEALTYGAHAIANASSRLYIIVSVINFAAMKTAELFYEKSLAYREPALMCRQASTHVPCLHADKHLLDGSPKPGTENYDVSAIFYLNDSFQGGNLVFPYKEVIVEPRAGTLVILPGDVDHAHYVDKITSGNRWSLTSFFTFIQ